MWIEFIASFAAATVDPPASATPEHLIVGLSSALWLHA